MTWNAVQAIATALQALALVVAGLWAYFRLRVERTHSPHIELNIACNLFGPQDGEYLSEFLLTAHNKGAVRQEFKNIILRVRGIKKDCSLEYWNKYKPRVKFSEKIFSAEVIHKEKYNYIFVEPNVCQEITYVTKIPSDIKFILCRVEFKYDLHTPHSIERVFELKNIQ